jgi:hypothetical protein
MTAIELETPTVPSPTPRNRRPSWPLLIVAVLAAAVLGGVVALVAHQTKPSAPTFIAAASGSNQLLPTVTVWYADGTRADGSRALAGPWTPDRPVRMFTVVSTGSCSITVDEVLTDTESAPVNRFAVCVWTTP